MAGESVRSIVDELAGILDREISVDDPHGQVLAYSAHTGGADDVRVRAILSRRVAPDVAAWQDSHGIAAARGPVRIPANPDLGMVARVCVPLRHGGVRTGYLWIIEGGRELSAAEHRDIAPFAARLAALLHEEPDPGRAAAALRALLAGEHGARADVAAVLGEHEPVRLIVVVGGAPDGRPPDSRHRPVVRCTVPGAHTVFATPADRADELAAALHTGAAAVGISDAHAALSAAPEAYREALAAAELALLDPALPRVQSWSGLGVYRLLIDAGATGDSGKTLLEPLREPFRHTLETYLDSGCDARLSAQRLHLHRTSLYYRLQRIAELTGRDLSSGADRLELHLALKLARLARRARPDG